MFLRAKSRTKDGKTHRYWSVVENRRVAGGGVVQRQTLYLGELNDNQRAGWVRTIEAFSGKKPKAKQLALFPDDRKELVALSSGDLRKALHLCMSCIKTVVVIGESNLGNVQCPGITPLTHIYPHINRSHYSFYSTCRLAG